MSDEIELTPAARRNVDAGATTGPGTLVCARCHQDKEPSRINSRACRSCSSTKAKRPAPSGTVELRVVVPRALFEKARLMADENSTTVAELLRQGLTLTTASTSLYQPTAKDWAAMIQWMHLNPGKVSYTQDEKILLRTDPDCRARFYARYQAAKGSESDPVCDEVEGCCDGYHGEDCNLHDGRFLPVRTAPKSLLDIVVEEAEDDDPLQTLERGYQAAVSRNVVEPEGIEHQ